MEIKQNPFSFYDFLGYFTPGALFLFFIFSFLDFTSFDFDVRYFDKYKDTGVGLFYIVFVIFSYAAGHFLSFLSSLTIERYLIMMVGHTSKNLLGFEKEKKFSEWRAEFFKNCKKSCVEKTKLKFCVEKFVKLLNFLFLAPVSFFDITFGKFLGLRSFYSKSLDNFLIEIIKSKLIVLIEGRFFIAKKISDEEKEGGNYLKDKDFFFCAYHYAVENCPNHFPKMQNYVALYGFLRTLTLINVFVFWIYIYFLIEYGLFFDCFWMIITAVITVVIYVLYMGFSKFYRRYSMEALMAIAQAKIE